MMCRVVPDSWMPLRCITNVIGARWTAAALKPFSAWPEIQPASPQWQMTCARVAVVRLEAERQAGRRPGTSRRAVPSSARCRPAPRTRGPAMSRLRRNAVDDPRLVEEAERRQRRVVADARVAVLDREVRALVVGGGERHQQRRNQLEAAAEMVDVVGLARATRATRSRCARRSFSSAASVSSSSARSSPPSRSSVNGSTRDSKRGPQ